MTLVQELRSVAKDKAARTLPFGQISPDKMLEWRAADEIERLHAKNELLADKAWRYDELNK